MNYKVSQRVRKRELETERVSEMESKRESASQKESQRQNWIDPNSNHPKS